MNRDNWLSVLFGIGLIINGVIQAAVPTYRTSFIAIIGAGILLLGYALKWR